MKAQLRLSTPPGLQESRGKKWLSRLHGHLPSPAASVSERPPQMGVGQSEPDRVYVEEVLFFAQSSLFDVRESGTYGSLLLLPTPPVPPGSTAPSDNMGETPSSGFHAS